MLNSKFLACSNLLVYVSIRSRRGFIISSLLYLESFSFGIKMFIDILNKHKPNPKLETTPILIYFNSDWIVYHCVEETGTDKLMNCVCYSSAT